MFHKYYSSTTNKDIRNNLDNSQKIALLSSIGLFDFTIISLYQLGVIKHLPDLPGKIFDSDHVNASPKAYALGFPDGPVSMVFYSLIMLLVGFRRNKKTRLNRWAGWLLGFIVLGHALGAADYLKDMIRQRKICLYCLIGTFINFGSVPLAWKLLFQKSES